MRPDVSSARASSELVYFSERGSGPPLLLVHGLMATGEMGFVQARKYDLEVWAPGVERWLEVSSCSNFRDYQARRMSIRYRAERTAKPQLVHTLNGSGLALARIVAALLETYQQPDGSVTIPPVLQHYLGTEVFAPPSA